MTARFGASTTYVRLPVRSANPSRASRFRTTGHRLQRGPLWQHRFLAFTSRGVAIVCEASERMSEDVEPEQRVTALELFFDLVFAFAIAQVTALIAHDPRAVPALAAPAAVAVLTCALMAYEFVHFHEARERLRHALT